MNIDDHQLRDIALALTHSTHIKTLNISNNDVIEWFGIKCSLVVMDYSILWNWEINATL